jgi:hypothetical protein
MPTVGKAGGSHSIQTSNSPFLVGQLRYSKGYLRGPTLLVTVRKPKDTTIWICREDVKKPPPPYQERKLRQ